MKFINTIFKKLSSFRKLTARSYKLKATRGFILLNPAKRGFRRRRNYLTGFTLVETLVAISILMVAIASPLTISQKGLASAIYAKDQTIASYLAQDAIEYLRNVSDRNVIGGNGWLNGINNCGAACVVDTSVINGSGITPCGGACPVLQYNTSTFIYNEQIAGGDNIVSPFTRYVTVAETVQNVEALVTVNISWKDKNKDRNLIISARIFKWR